MYICARGRRMHENTIEIPCVSSCRCVLVCSSVCVRSRYTVCYLTNAADASPCSHITALSSRLAAFPSALSGTSVVASFALVHPPNRECIVRFITSAATISRPFSGRSYCDQTAEVILCDAAATSGHWWECLNHWNPTTSNQREVTHKRFIDVDKDGSATYRTIYII